MIMHAMDMHTYEVSKAHSLYSLEDRLNISLMLRALQVRLHWHTRD